ncbi:unnamed protein product [Lactuca saligna]|uniref:Uncharacterized protein n=1 Tax=Lactuca saligna TaxID=75948 RepID=A0AA35YTL3_LACSI|nr:unnamed protein product [Lactuca saligna]
MFFNVNGISFMSRDVRQVLNEIPRKLCLKLHPFGAPPFSSPSENDNSFHATMSCSLPYHAQSLFNANQIRAHNKFSTKCLNRLCSQLLPVISPLVTYTIEKGLVFNLFGGGYGNSKTRSSPQKPVEAFLYLSTVKPLFFVNVWVCLGYLFKGQKDFWEKFQKTRFQGIVLKRSMFMYVFVTIIFREEEEKWKKENLSTLSS